MLYPFTSVWSHLLELTGLCVEFGFVVPKNVLKNGNLYKQEV